MRKKRWIKIVTGLVIILFSINIVASFYFYNLAIARNVKDFLQGNSDLEVSAEARHVFLEGDWRTWVQDQSFEQWEMTTNDGLALQGYFLEAKEPTNKTVIFTHGYLGKGEDMGLYGKYYYETLGYNIFFMDMRGHGKSEGNYIGFGWHDRLDVIDWLEVIMKKQEDTQFVLHGLSMGAATVLMASGEELPRNVKAIIADSPYTSVYDMFAYQLKRMYHLPAVPILPTTSIVTELQAGYSIIEASALEQVQKANVPILYIHGNADNFVPTEMSETLYENTKSPAEMITIDGAGHGEAFVLNKEKYVKALNAFLHKYLPK